MLYKSKKEKGLFDEELRLKKLSKQNDPLLKIKYIINWELFRPDLEKVLAKESKSKGGRPPYDYILLFKILILQKYYNLSDDQIEFQILDRLTFMRFLDLSLSDDVPDSKTIWNFKEAITMNKLIEKLFDTFNQLLYSNGMIANEGRIIDASFSEVPKQRNNKEENKQIKEGGTPSGWSENPNKLRQKDIDARWTQKNNINYYGYKSHIKCDMKNKIIIKYKTTDASVHDSQIIEELIDENDKGQSIWADGAYAGEPIKRILKEKKVKNKIHEKGLKNKLLSQKQKDNNTEKSKIRARVEHIFGFIENNMKGSFIRSIGIKRANTAIGLMNLTYNMYRYAYLKTV